MPEIRIGACDMATASMKASNRFRASVALTVFMGAASQKLFIFANRVPRELRPFHAASADALGICEPSAVIDPGYSEQDEL